MSPNSLEPVGDGVFAWLPTGARVGVANAGVVIDDDGITVVDALMVRSQWEPFRKAVSAMGRPVRRLILTHGRIDVVGGSTAFPNAAVYAAPATSDVLDLAMPIAAYQHFMPEFADEFEDLAETGTRAVTHLIDGPAQLTERLEVLPAHGYSAGDLLVLVGDSDVCFAGGLCSFGVTPLAFEADFPAWIDVLDVIGELANVIVPAHGAIGGAAEIGVLIDYLRACLDAAANRSNIATGPWDAWVDRSNDTINIERAAMLASGHDGIPTAMLRAMGM